MNKSIIFGLLLICVFLLNGCNFSNQSSTGSVQETTEQINNDKSPIDTLLLLNAIWSADIQPVSILEVFQVLDGIYFETFDRDFNSCLVKTYTSKYAAEPVNTSALFITSDKTLMLYDGLKIEGDDFIIIDTYTYDTQGTADRPSRSKTVPVYVRKSEILHLLGQ